MVASSQRYSGTVFIARARTVMEVVGRGHEKGCFDEEDVERRGAEATREKMGLTKLTTMAMTTTTMTMKTTEFEIPIIAVRVDEFQLSTTTSALQSILYSTPNFQHGRLIHQYTWN